MSAQLKKTLASPDTEHPCAADKQTKYAPEDKKPDEVAALSSHIVVLRVRHANMKQNCMATSFGQKSLGAATEAERVRHGVPVQEGQENPLTHFSPTLVLPMR